MEGNDTKARALDSFLIASVRLGDRKAFDLLAERWDPRLRAHAWRLLGDAEQASEAVQDGWVEIIRGLKSLRDDAAFPAWAYRIVSRRCARLIGEVQRRRQLSDTLATESMDDPAEPADFISLRRAIRALPPEQRAAVALFYFDGLSIAETAVALDVPAGTVKTRLMHARRKLLIALEEAHNA